ncbi:unnamed protein product [Echinostoma caproni]|uniref:Neur_chan_LBD domain-containing protein n=1 Tax=Echinostoma caproni TaxID=27848 RepID=A0A183B7F5_9TREM|nr:unnamed protein product [Echinostoma caproni]
MTSMTTRWLLLLLCFAYSSHSIPSPDNTRSVDFGLEAHDRVKDLRVKFESTLVGDDDNATYFEQIRASTSNNTVVRIKIAKEHLKFFDNSGSRQFPAHVIYSSKIPIHLSYDLDSIHAANLSDVKWYWLPPGVDKNVTIPLNITAKQIGLSYVRFWINEGVARSTDEIQSWALTNSNHELLKNLSGLKLKSADFPESETVGFPLLVLRAQGVVQLIFRIVVVILVSIFIFTMGCELDIAVMKAYAKRPVGPAIGWGCQFVIMPLVSPL